MSGVLEGILASKRAEIAKMTASRLKTTAVLRAPQSTTLRGDVLRRGRRDPLRLIAEHKRKSPSAGALSTKLSPAERTLAYARAGASMISVLCDGPFFDGAYSHVADAKQAIVNAGLSTPVLAKEFVLETVQIEEALLNGADAVLLIARIVDAAKLKELAHHAREMNVEPVVEVVDEKELDAALATEALLIGVNARDLDTLAIHTERAVQLLGQIPGDRIGIHLSGVKNADDVKRVAGSTADAALIGEALMREDDPTPLLGSMLTAAR